MAPKESLSRRLKSSLVSYRVVAPGIPDSERMIL